MNTSNIKKYAPKARADFINAVTKRLNHLGIYADKDQLRVSESRIDGSLMQIDGVTLDVKLSESRQKLVKQAEKQGFNQFVEHTAYTWFNRFCAIRYMELHDYLEHGLRVLSHPDKNNSFEIIDHAQDIAEGLGLSRVDIVELKLAGNKDGQLYRELLIGQCHQLHKAMPFLFEALDDETELLLPDNLTRTDSILRSLVDDIPEEDWQNIEIIGWLYQFYISEKKDLVIGKVVKSEGIPAATQLFTPNWIVKYMVQNSLGAQWLATYPDSPIKEQMEYYIEPAEQTDEVNAQLATITPKMINPEELTLIDPASGSGHILVEAYELFKAIYLERGYRQRDIAKLILEKNLFGLDIDGRAAQLTGFALMMKGRTDDRRLFERGVRLNVLALRDSGQSTVDSEQLAGGDDKLAQVIDELKRLFEHATTFGSLIQVPEWVAEMLPELKKLSETSSQDLFVADAFKRLVPLVQQAELLAMQYDAVVANPPYMGGKGLNSELKTYMGDAYADVKSDLFSAFMVRCSAMGSPTARVGMMSPNVWMYISSHENLRSFISSQRTLVSLVELPLSGFKGATVQICTFTFSNTHVRNTKGSFIRLVDFKGGDTDMADFTKQAIQDHKCGWFFEVSQDEFRKIPGSPVAYWVSEMVGRAYSTNRTISEVSNVCNGIKTGNVDLFIRSWPEVSSKSVGYRMANIKQADLSQCSWFPYHKGGDFRRWYGNLESVIHWKVGGEEIKNYSPNNSIPNSRIRPENNDFYFQSGICWNAISSSYFSVRHLPPGCMFDIAGPALFSRNRGDEEIINGFLTSKVASFFMSIVNTTVNILVLDIKRLPLPICWDEKPWREQVTNVVRVVITVSQIDWDSYERSWDFQSLPILTASYEPTPSLESSYTAWITQNRDTIAEMKRLEEENNRLFIDAYGLENELNPDVPIEKITLMVNPAYRYGGKLTIEAQWIRFRQDTLQELVSYAIGCMMGRYSLNAPGLIYAQSGNEGFDTSRYSTFSADDDGIIPLTDTEWFADDAANILFEFISVAWDSASLDKNLSFLSENLSPKRNETSRETIRRYLCSKFFKDHLKTYKKRPIYWLFSSGKQKAFECLVYLHRYNEGTLARMRTEYVTPLLGKFDAYAEQLQKQQDDASSTTAANRFKKELTALQKKQTELREFDDKLKHYADMQISLDLDDGVKVNYGKFGDLLSDVKAIHGKTPEKI